MDNTNYTSYQGMMAKVDSALSGMEGIANGLGLEETGKSLTVCREKLESHHFSIGIMGEFKRGKSTVINSLLERDIMPADILPCSATMNRVTYDMQPHVELKMMNGSTKSIDIDKLTDYVTKINEENESRAAEVQEAVVYYPCRFCQNGVDIIDTPGLNDDERMNKICEEVIPKLDAVIMVLVHGSPFSMSESDFVRNTLITSGLGRLIFLVNKIDQVGDEDDIARVIDQIKGRIRVTVLERIASIYGKDSQDYKEAETKLGSIRIFPFSARNALKGKKSGDTELIKSSGTEKFEATLTKLLTEERGAIEIGSALNTIQRAVLDIQDTIENRRSAMSMSAAEFEARQVKALEQLNQLRSQKQNESRRLRARSREVQKELTEKTTNFYSELEEKLLSLIDGFNPNPELLAKPEKQEAAAASLQETLSSTANKSVNEFTEKIIMGLQDIIGKEALSSAEFTSDILQQMKLVLSTATGAKQKFVSRGEVVGTGVEFLVTLLGPSFLGIGGFISGYKEAGIKGAVTGGLVGSAAAFTSIAILSSMSVVGLPLALIGFTVAPIVGKKVAKEFFKADIGLKALNKIKQMSRENVAKALTEMKANRDIENWINQLVNDKFDELIKAVEGECEKMLRDTEASMTEIHKDLTRNEASREQVTRQLNEAESKCAEILETLKPIHQKVEAALKND